MKIESKTINNITQVIQKFILQDIFPIPKGTLCMISAKGGIGKTNLSLILTSEYLNKHQGNVALWLTEDEEGNVKHRINTLLENNLMKVFNQKKTHYITTDPIHLAKNFEREFKPCDESFDGLKEFCAINDIRLLVIDPLLAFFGGNENDNGQARTFMQPFINWCKELDITIILIHHASKGEVTNTRGAGAFIDAVRIAYTISIPFIENEKKHLIEDETKANKGIRAIKCVKDNRGAMSHIMRVYNQNPFEIQIAPAIINININSFVQNSKYKKGIETEFVMEARNESYIPIL